MMTQKKIFCEECRNDVDYMITEVPMTGTIKKTTYHYTGKEAHCHDCGSLLYVPKINDYNLKALYDVYRTANGIIPLEHIMAIPEKYAIGKRPLSLLLGWGEQTFSRYYDGDIPTKQYSDMLTRLYNDPAYYSEILEAGKDSLCLHGALRRRPALYRLDERPGSPPQGPPERQRRKVYPHPYRAGLCLPGSVCGQVRRPPAGNCPQKADEGPERGPLRRVDG